MRRSHGSNRRCGHYSASFTYHALFAAGGCLLLRYIGKGVPLFIEKPASWPIYSPLQNRAGCQRQNEGAGSYHAMGTAGFGNNNYGKDLGIHCFSHHRCGCYLPPAFDEDRPPGKSVCIRTRAHKGRNPLTALIYKPRGQNCPRGFSFVNHDGCANIRWYGTHLRHARNSAITWTTVATFKHARENASDHTL